MRQTSVVDHVDTTPGARQFHVHRLLGHKVTVFDLHTPTTGSRSSGPPSWRRRTGRSAAPAAVDWVQLRHGSVVDEYDEMLQPTVYPHHPELVEFAAAAAAGLTPAAAAENGRDRGVRRAHLRGRHHRGALNRD